MTDQQPKVIRHVFNLRMHSSK